MNKKSVILCVVALLCSACGTVSTIPLDDAYYWPDKNAPTAPISADTIVSTPGAAPIEYINVQDTTVTIRIKK